MHWKESGFHINYPNELFGLYLFARQKRKEFSMENNNWRLKWIYYNNSKHKKQ